MKIYTKYIVPLLKTFAIILILTGGLMTPQSSYAQVPDPPNGHGSNDDNPPGGGAPISGGLFILLGLGIAYGGKKFYEIRKNDVSDSP